MKSRFIIKTEKEIVGLNGVVIPPASIEAEMEYSLAEVAGMYGLYRKILKETPEIIEDMVKIITHINTKRDEEAARQNKNMHKHKEVGSQIIVLKKNEHKFVMLKENTFDNTEQIVEFNLSQTSTLEFYKDFVDVITTLITDAEKIYIYIDLCDFKNVENISRIVKNSDPFLMNLYRRSKLEVFTRLSELPKDIVPYVERMRAK